MTGSDWREWLNSIGTLAAGITSIVALIYARRANKRFDEDQEPAIETFEIQTTRPLFGIRIVVRNRRTETLRIDWIEVLKPRGALIGKERERYSYGGWGDALNPTEKSVGFGRLIAPVGTVDPIDDVYDYRRRDSADLEVFVLPASGWIGGTIDLGLHISRTTSARLPKRYLTQIRV